MYSRSAFWLAVAGVNTLASHTMELFPPCRDCDRPMQEHVALADLASHPYRLDVTGDIPAPGFPWNMIRSVSVDTDPL